MKRFSLSTLSLFFVAAMFLCCVVASVAGFFGLIYPATSFVLIFPIFALILYGVKVFQLACEEKILIGSLVGIWLLHATGLFVPETGFDALWYHLPVVDQFIRYHHIFSIPSLYQSLNPLFSDLIFLLGYQTGGIFGAKIIAYLFALGLILVSYQLARQFLNRFWSLVFILVISTFQVVTWQSTSFYVDVAKAFWEVAAIWCLIFAEQKSSRKFILLNGFFVGASLATKAFSFLLLPTFVIGIILLVKKRISFVVLFLCSCLVVAAPFYFYTYQQTGNPLYSLGIHVDKLGEIGGESSLIQYLVNRTWELPSSLAQLTLFSRDYTTLIFLVFLGAFILALPQLIKNRTTLFLLFFSGAQWLIWWYVPPLSTRYALSGFIVLLLIYFITLEKNTPRKKFILAAVVLSILFNLLPRVVVLQRNFKYILERQTKEKYLKQFYDGNIDQHIINWYHLPQPNSE